MSDRDLQPLPVTESCLVETAIPYGEVYLGEIVSSRSAVALEVLPRDKEQPSAIRRFVLVSGRHNCRVLLGMLNRSLRKEMTIPSPRSDLPAMERESVGKMFERMTACGAAVWFLPITRLGGALLFVRKPGDDPNLEGILNFNRRRRRPGLEATEVTILTRDVEDGDAGAGRGPRKIVQVALRLRAEDQKSLLRRVHGRRGRSR
ncbi:MAG: hypothetical protein ACREH8_09535 [Opitutaceae bacterium]